MPIDRGSWARLDEPVPARRLVLFRVGLGVLLAIAAVRFWAYGWVDDLLLAPTVQFHYQGFGWVRPLPPPWMSLCYLAMAGLALGFAHGRFGRWCLAGYGVLFTYAELVDKTLYLNHYYLVSILVAMLALSSVATVRWRDRGGATVPRWELWAFRAQVALVYFYAGLWKLNRDWLVDGEPLASWLWGFRFTPGVGPLLAADMVPVLMSWGGALFDLTIWIWLLWRPTARAALVVCVGFHATVGLLFPIGLFSFVMVLAATLLLPVGEPPLAAAAPPGGRWRTVVFGVHILVQLLLPWRFVLHEGDVNWHEQGYRFSWRVMLNEKRADVTFARVDEQGVRHPLPVRDLTALQARQMGFQPDMLLEYAHRLCRRVPEAASGAADVRVDARVAHNGRRAVPLMKDVNLCALDEPMDAVWPRPPPVTGAPPVR